jgi:hypothetical protein
MREPYDPTDRHPPVRIDGGWPRRYAPRRLHARRAAPCATG